MGNSLFLLSAGLRRVVVLGACVVLLSSAVAGAERQLPLRERVLWERDDWMPPHHSEKVRLRATLSTRDGIPVATKIVQMAPMHHGRVPTLVVEIAGEELTGAASQDLNNDGVKEILLTFCPPRNQSLVRLVFLCYDRKGRVYEKVWETGPETGIEARFVKLPGEKTDADWGLVVERRPQGARTASEPTTYRFQGGRLHQFRRGQAAPVTPLDQLAWGVEWARRGELDRARDTLIGAAGSLTGSARVRAFTALGRVLLAQGKIPEASKALLEASNGPVLPPYTNEAKRLATLVASSGSSGEAIAGVMRAQIALDGGRFDEALRGASAVLGLSVPVGGTESARTGRASEPAVLHSEVSPGQIAVTPVTDEALMILAQVHVATNRTGDAIRCLQTLVVDCPKSQFLPQAQIWLYKLAPPPKELLSPVASPSPVPAARDPAALGEAIQGDR